MNNVKIILKLISGKKYKKPKQKSTKKKDRGKKKNSSSLPSPKEIFEELVRNNMIKKSVTSKFSEFQGEVNYSGSALRGEPYFIDSPYGLGDVRQVSLFCRLLSCKIL